MKKLLVLALVLAVAGIANAGLSVSNKTVSYECADPLVGGINLYVGSVDLVPEAFTNFVYRTAGAPVSAPAITIYDAATAVEAGLPWTKGLIQLTWGDPSLTPNPAGFWVSFDVVTAVVATVDVMDATGVYPMESVVVTPEPMTMLLLGLGGLFLRRK